MRRSSTILRTAIVLGLVLIAAGVLISSLRWRYQLDAPLYLYTAFLMDRFGAMPYRDVFDPNGPGTTLFYLLPWKLTGGSALGVRVFDIVWLLATMAVSAGFMRAFGWPVAIAGATMWALGYLEGGPNQILQRELIAMLPLGLGVLVEVGTLPVLRRVALASMLIAVAATIKPALALGLVALIASELHALPANDRGRALAQRIAACAVGAGVVAVAMFAWLWWAGAWAAFREIVTQYWPLYRLINGNAEVIAESAYSRALVSDSLQYATVKNLLAWLVPIALPLWIARREPRARFLAYLVIAYALYPFVNGKFWLYHWIPFFYFAGPAAALALWSTPRMQFALPVTTAALVWQLWSSAVIVPSLRGAYVSPAPKRVARVDAIAAFLEPRLSPGDTVQPLDWTGGAVHAMLVARARLATRFIFDVQFYHHAHREYPQRWRREFIAQMNQTRPRFIVHMLATSHPHGPETDDNFPELTDLMAGSYAPALRGDGFVIYERQ